MIDDLKQHAASSQGEPGTEPQFRTLACHREAVALLHSTHLLTEEIVTIALFIPQPKYQWVLKVGHMFYSMKPFQVGSLKKKVLAGKHSHKLLGNNCLIIPSV